MAGLSMASSMSAVSRRCRTATATAGADTLTLMPVLVLVLAPPPCSGDCSAMDVEADVDGGDAAGAMPSAS